MAQPTKFSRPPSDSKYAPPGFAGTTHVVAPTPTLGSVGQKLLQGISAALKTTRGAKTPSPVNVAQIAPTPRVRGVPKVNQASNLYRRGAGNRKPSQLPRA